MRAATAALALLLFGLLLGAAPVRAEPPPQLYGQVSDRADVGLSTEVSSALERLRADKSLGLYVVFVDTFDGTDPGQWTAETAWLSGLTSNDVLLAVAVDDGRYGYWVDQSFHQDTFHLSEAELDDLFIREVEPRLSRGDWSGAVIALADGLRGGGISFLAVVILVVGGIWAVVAVGAYLLNWGRRPPPPLEKRPISPVPPGYCPQCGWKIKQNLIFPVCNCPSGTGGGAGC